MHQTREQLGQRGGSRSNKASSWTAKSCRWHKRVNPRNRRATRVDSMPSAAETTRLHMVSALGSPTDSTMQNTRMPLGLVWNLCIDLGSPNCVGAAQLPITAVYHLIHHLWCIAGWLEWVMDKPGLQIVPTVPLTYARCSHQHRGAEHTHAHPYKPEREPCMHVAVATSRVRTVAWIPQRFSRIPCFWA